MAQCIQVEARNDQVAAKQAGVDIFPASEVSYLLDKLPGNDGDLTRRARCFGYSMVSIQTAFRDRNYAAGFLH
jgi:hypothetical protein